MKIYKQETNQSCGIACLRSIMNHLGENLSKKEILDNHNNYQLKNGGVRNPIISLGKMK